jgi:putative hemolysin
MRSDDPFHLSAPPDAPLTHRAALAAARPFLAAILGAGRYRRLYDRIRNSGGERFSARALDVLRISAEISPGDAGKIPAGGPVIVAANHPHGALDGLLLAEIVAAGRGDVRVLGNRLLARIPELAGLCLFVDPFERTNRAARSAAGLRAALDWLRHGHVLIVFPAGEVAHQSSESTPHDSPWHTTVGRLALRTGAAVVPAFIEGRNSHLFYKAGRLHPGLRTLLLARELLTQRGRRVTVRLGRPIRAVDLSPHAHDAVATTAQVREAVDRLATRSDDDAPAQEPVVPPVDRLALELEIRNLRAEHKLLGAGALEVFSVPAPLIPNVLVEIGRLREITFRQVGEGTGRAIDLDRFDEHYLHLFVWNSQRREIAGAYRVGPTDTIVGRHGIDGLYTSTLFHYDERLLARLSPALELGRSFVQADYQRTSNALLLLWKGIGQLIVRSNRYRVLFGPVSISSRYGDHSQQLLKAFLAENHYDRELGELVHALTPPTDTPLPAGVAAETVRSIADVDRMVARLERDGKGIPVLLRQYLRLLGFNVDPAFGDALDALMTVDLATVEPAILSRYLGREEAARFLRWHGTVAA